MEKINKNISVKLFRLLSFLQKTCEEFRTVAEEVKDDDIKMTLRELAVEANQYEQELNSQLQCLKIQNIDFPISVNCEELLKDVHSYNKVPTDEEILGICCKSQISFEKAYRNVLNEYFPYPDLRRMLIYQLNGIKCAFMKMKLLSSVQWNYTWYT